MTRIPASGPDMPFSCSKPPPQPSPACGGGSYAASVAAVKPSPASGQVDRRACGGPVRAGPCYHRDQHPANLEDRVTAPPDADDLALVKQWFRRLTEQVQAVDFAGARPLFAEDMIAFGTFEDFVTGRDAVEAAQWQNVWPVTSGFHYRIDDIRAIVSPDRLTAIGMGVFHSTGYHQDGTPYDRPGRTTVALSRARVGEDWVADHTHMSLFRDVPTRSFGQRKPG